jgi:uncharacterized Zn finger protein
MGVRVSKLPILMLPINCVLFNKEALYLEHLKQKREVPIVTEQDPRLRSLREITEKEATWDEEDEEEEWDEDTVHPLSPRSKKAAADTLSAFLEKQTKEQLIALLKEQAERHPAVRQALQDRIDLSAGAVKELVDAVREEIDELSGEPDWEDDWGGGGAGSDYARLLDRLQALLVAGHADKVIELGQELLEAGTRRVEMTDDEGETAEEIASCMDLVFEALSHSSLSPAEQMLWTIDAGSMTSMTYAVGQDPSGNRSMPRQIGIAWQTSSDSA